ncbi:SPOR domain-containing protein [Thiofilum flexile]|uniref:SPOR domain-containing protein n=1 Tax=Thiofilum flexile TaxID=125627 RepID=UPI0003766335|nr:SPOR domain-containing protein [Thiofilum flexile]
MDNKSTTKRMIGAVVLVLIAALLLAWLLKGKNPKQEQDQVATAQQTQQVQPISGFPGVSDPNALPPAPDGPSSPPALVADAQQATATATAEQSTTAAPNADLQTAQAPTPDNVTTFEIRPETRNAIDQNGNVVAATGSMGSDETQAAPSDAVTNVNEAAQSQTASTETQPEAQTESTAAVASGVAAGVAAATATASKGSAETTQASKSTSTKEVVVAKPSSTATSPSTKTVVLTSTTTTKAAQPRLVNERPVPEVSSRTQTVSVASNAKSSTSTSTASAQKASAGSVDAAKRNGYVIQVLATADRTKADTIRQTIATDGYPAFIAQGVANGKRVYRVRIGTYKAKSDAVTVQSRMKARYGQNQLVQNSFVTNNNN